MRIGIIGAMDEEIALYLEAMGQTTNTVKAGVTYYAGEMEGKSGISSYPRIASSMISM
jgi:adenosylhomocysteine nucleosidase